MHSPAVSAGPAGASAAKERFLVLPIIILILAQMGTSGDNGALSLAASALTSAPPPPRSSSPTWSIRSWAAHS